MKPENIKSEEDWNMQLESSIGAWLDAMLELPDNHTAQDANQRADLADHFRRLGLIVVGEPKDTHWHWRVAEGFDEDAYQRLLDT
jgi:hypothetical protein